MFVFYTTQWLAFRQADGLPKCPSHELHNIINVFLSNIRMISDVIFASDVTVITDAPVITVSLP